MSVSLRNTLMRCSKCGNIEDKVVDSRAAKDGSSIRRRRECLACAHRFTTYEVIERIDFQVVKDNGARETFDREKLMRGMIKACEKRPVSVETLEKAAEEVAVELQNQNLREIPAKLIGPLVMRKLEKIDRIAYVRYASVYRNFHDVGEFIDEINSLEKRPTTDNHQQKLF